MKLIVRIAFSFGVIVALIAGQYSESPEDGREPSVNVTYGMDQWHQLHKYFRRPPKFDKPMIHNVVGMSTFFFTASCSIAALVFAWLSFYSVYFETNRELLRMEEKIKFCTDFTARRKFPDDVVERLSLVANFDVATNREEISTMLKSLGPAPAPGRREPAPI